MVKILIVDDHTITREGLRSLIEKQPEMQVVGEAENGIEAVKLANKLTPDIVIMDVSMPESNGIEATRMIVSQLPNTKVITLSMHSDRRYVIQMLKAGSSGYLLKNCMFDELIQAINTVRRNISFMSPAITDTIVKDYVETLTKTIDDTPSLSTLTSKEREVLQMLAEGLSSSQIASKLFISIKTVSTHRRQIMAKLNIFSTAELTKFAIREGLTDIEK